MPATQALPRTRPGQPARLPARPAEQADSPTDSTTCPSRHPADDYRKDLIQHAPRAAAKKRDDMYRDRRRRKVCAFCADKTAQIDYKEINRLRRYLSERAKIEPRRKTGTCAAHQRQLAVALKRARHVALLPYAPEHLRV